MSNYFDDLEPDPNFGLTMGHLGRSGEEGRDASVSGAPDPHCWECLGTGTVFATTVPCSCGRP